MKSAACADLECQPGKIFSMSLCIVFMHRRVRNPASPLSRKRECTTNGAVFVQQCAKSCTQRIILIEFTEFDHSLLDKLRGQMR
jgi:hypothetical protein